MIYEVLNIEYRYNPSNRSGASDGHVLMYRGVSVITVITVHEGWKHINLSKSRYRYIGVA
jgi:hypothetical protein